MKLQYFLIGLLLATSIMGGISFFINDQKQETGYNVNVTMNSDFNKTNTLLTQINSQAETSKANTGASSTGTFALQTNSFSTLLKIWDSYGVAVNMTATGFKEMEIPDWIQTFIFGALSLMLMFAILAAIFFGRSV